MLGCEECGGDSLDASAASVWLPARAATSSPVDGDLKTLHAIRSSVAAAAAACNRNAKLVVQATSDLIAMRKHRRRSILSRVVGRLR